MFLPIEGEKPEDDVLDLKRKRKKSSNSWLWNRCIRKFTRKLLCFPSFIHQRGDRFPLQGLGLEAHAGILKDRVRPALFYRLPPHPPGLMLRSEPQGSGKRGLRVLMFLLAFFIPFAHLKQQNLL